MTLSIGRFKKMLFAIGWMLSVPTPASAPGNQSGRPPLPADTCAKDQRFPLVPPVVAGTSGVATSGVATSGVATSDPGSSPTQFIYTGDLQGGLWRSDLSAGLIAKQIFSAVDAQDHPQPISATPVIAPAKEGGYLILFGTGKYLDPGDADPRNIQHNTFYAIHDDPVGHPGARAASRTTLARRTLQQASAQGKAAYTIQGDEMTQQDAKKTGWYLDFAPSTLYGERSIWPAIIADGQVFFNTLIPSGQPCAADFDSRSYAVDIHTGKSKQEGRLTGYQPGHSLQGSPVLVLGQTEAGKADGSGSRIDIQHYQLINFASVAGPTESITNGQTNIRVGRLSWRAIPSWQELRTQP